MIKLKEMRKSRGLTQTELAEKVRHADPTVDQTTISVLERGELYPSEKLRDALMAALDCTEADLYDGIEAFFVPAPKNEVSETTKTLACIFADYTTRVIGRRELLELATNYTGTEISDRTLRKWISRARREGMVIANDQDGQGYYLPETLNELSNLYRQNEHRALAILAQQKWIRRRLKDAGEA